MSKKKINFIDSLDGLNSECPFCQNINQQFFSSKKHSNESLEWMEMELKKIELRKQNLKNALEQSYQAIYTNTKAVNIGFISERLFPALPSFKFNHNDCRSTGGDPIDYVVFEGLSEKNQVDFIHFVDVKTGNARLSPRQEEIKQVIKHRNVKFRIY